MPIALSLSVPGSFTRMATIHFACFAVCALAGMVLSPAAAQDNLAGRITRAIVKIDASVPADARTADSLGTERSGSGVVIDTAGLILTIGYVVLEADGVVVTDADGAERPAEILAYDHESGFGLLRAGNGFRSEPLELGGTDGLDRGTQLLAAAYGNVRPVRIADRREFAGYWEYLLDEAIFTYPPHPRFAGAALIDQNGKLVGIGSLFVRDAASPTDRRVLPGNMFIPIDELAEPFPALLTDGRRDGPLRPWIGLYGEAARDRVFVVRLAEGGPAAKAGISVNDLVIGIGDRPVDSLAAMYRAMWALGPAGVDVPVTVLRGLELETITIPSMDRYRWLRLGRSY